MARPGSTVPTDRELEILHVLWDDGPQVLSQICAGLRQQREVATTTIATMLKVMLKKKLVVRKQKKRGSIWSAKVSREATSTGMVRKLVERLFDGSAKRLVSHLFDSSDLDEKEIQELRNILDAHRASSKENES